MIIVLNELFSGYPLIVGVKHDDVPRVQSGKVRKFLSLQFETTCVDEDGWFVSRVGDCSSSDEHRSMVDYIDDGNHYNVARRLLTIDRETCKQFDIVFGRPGAMFVSSIMKNVKLEMHALQKGMYIINDCGMQCEVGNLSHQTNDESVLKTIAELCSTLRGTDVGTISSTIITVSSEGNVMYHYSDGNSVLTSPVSLSSLNENTKI